MAEKAKLEPIEQYIAEREEKRQRGLDVPKHEKYRDGEKGLLSLQGSGTLAARRWRF